MTILLLAFGALLATVAAEPFVHSSVKRSLGEQASVSLFVSFSVPDVSAAHTPEDLAKKLSTQGGPQAASLVLSPEEYHLARGRFVYDTLAQAHHKTSQMLKLSLRSGKLDSYSIPISNSFIIHEATSDTVNELLRLPGLEEIVTTSGHRINLPKPMLSPRPKSFQSVFEENQTLIDLIEENSESKEAASINELPDPKDIQWNIKKIKAPDVWKELGAQGKGAGIVYGIADTGTAFRHPLLSQNYQGLRGNVDGRPIYDHNYAWFDGVRTPIGASGLVASSSKSSCPIAGIEPCDDQGHGTHVASIAVGSNGYGVAPSARWIACRNMDAGVGAPQAYIACLNFFLAPHDIYGRNPRPELRPHVVGNSYGCPDSEGCSPRALKSAVEALRSAGVFMAVSAGNEGPSCGSISSPPAIEPSIIAVAATDREDNLARFSSRGPVSIDGVSWAKPDLSAPGVAIKAAYPLNDGERVLSGTSMAAPHVGGAASIIMSACPCLERNIDKIQVILQASAEHLLPPFVDSFCGRDNANSIPNNYFGYGRINVHAAVKACRTLCQFQEA